MELTEAFPWLRRSASRRRVATEAARRAATWGPARGSAAPKRFCN